MDLAALLTQLSNTLGVAGREGPICDVVAEEFKRYAQVRVDRLGNVIGLMPGHGPEPRRKLMLAAHMDQIGLIVSWIEKGFLRLSRVGGIDERVLLGQEILVHGRQTLPGVIGFPPPHVLPADQRDKLIPLDEMWADVGLPAAQVEKLVRIGDVVCLRHQATPLKNGYLTGQALDNRASVAAVLVCLDLLTTRQPAWDVLAVATVQEETRLLGAATSAYALTPDAAIAIDVTFGSQNGVSENRTFDLDQGPTIGIGPNMHPSIRQRLVETAKRLEMSYRMEPTPGPSGTDGWAIQVAHGGIPTGLLSIPLRYMHTPVEMVALKDIERAGRLLAEFIVGLDEAFVKTLTYCDEEA